MKETEHLPHETNASEKQVVCEANKEGFMVMTAGSFPSDPSRRKAILVLKQHDIERCDYEPGAARALIDEEFYVLQFPVQPQGECPSALQNLLDAGLARPGGMLVQSPYDKDTYEDALLAPQRFALAKHMYFSTLCMHLGAKEVVVEQIDQRTRNGKSTINLNGERSGVGAKVTVESEELEKFRAQMSLCDKFTGGVPDVQAAERLLRRTGLWSDITMRTLVDHRRGETNQQMSRTLVLSLSSEAKSNLNVAGRINIKAPPFLKISAEYAQVINEKYDYTLSVSVRF